MVEPVLMFHFLCQLDGVHDSCQFAGVHTDDVDAAICMAWHQEAVRDDDGALIEDIAGYNLDVVRPLKVDALQLDRLQI